MQLSLQSFEPAPQASVTGAMRQARQVEHHPLARNTVNAAHGDRRSEDRRSQCPVRLQAKLRLTPLVSCVCVLPDGLSSELCGRGLPPSGPAQLKISALPKILSLSIKFRALRHNDSAARPVFPTKCDWTPSCTLKCGILSATRNHKTI